MKFKLYTADGKKGKDKEIEIPELEGKTGLQALKDVLVAYQSNCRQGTASAKTRADVAGSGKKIYRQKGTGHARHGDRQSPIFIGGGIAHPPKPRDWTKHLNKKVRKIALIRAVFDRATLGDISLVEEFKTETPKTKDFASFVAKIYPEGNVLLVDNKFDKNALLASRNLERVHVVDANSVNAWDIVRFKNVLVSEQGFTSILGRVANG